MEAAIEGYLGMIKAAASVVGAAVLALGVLSSQAQLKLRYTLTHMNGRDGRSAPASLASAVIRGQDRHSRLLS